jgi:hypothetical protein
MLMTLVPRAQPPPATAGGTPRLQISRDETAPELRWIGACLLLMIALQVYVSGAVESWTVAGAFGQRRFVGCASLLVIGLAALRDRVQGRVSRPMLKLAVALSIWWNVALIAEFGTSMMNRQRLELGRNAYDAFVTLPRMAPEILHRYFTARSSFYRPAEPR